jgi:uncharacterized membrane protein
MTALILGLVVFLGVHSVRIVAPDWRAAQIARRGENGWKGLYSIASGIGLALIVWGYGAARMAPVDLWLPPVWTRHLAALLTLPAFVLLTAAYVPGTRLKAALQHPMLLGVKVWALAHLLANGRLADVLLFGGFLAWAVLDYRAARQRDRDAGTVYPAGRASKDVLAAAIGTLAWAVFSFWGHAWLIGVRPF